MHGVPSLWGYGHIVATSLHPKYPLVANPRIQNSALPQDMFLGVNFNMLPFIMFNSTPVWVHGNNFEHYKRYRAPVIKLKKEKENG